MSFVRVGRPQQHSKGKRPVRPKKAAAPRGEWVSTVHDLSVHKLTPAELSHRHEIHKSHNQAAAQWELKEKALKRRLRHGGSPVPLDKASLSIIREVFSDQLLLQDVLNRSDRALAVVKDLFGDAPRRQTGHPSVTVAPNCDSDTELPVLQRPDPPTHLSLLSQSMMDQEALNEHSEEDAHPSSSDDHVVRRVNVGKMKAKSRHEVRQQQKARPRFREGDGGDVPITPCASGRGADDTALNATVALQRVRTNQLQSEDGKDETSSLVSQVLNPELPLSQSETSRNNRIRKSVSRSLNLDGSSAVAVSGDQSSLGLLQAMLGQVEADLDSLSPDTASRQSPNHHRTQGLTGFSVALVSTLGRLVHSLKQREDESQKEAEERRRLEEEVKEQRGLIDALTAETMTLREEATALRAELQQRTEEVEQKLDSVVLVMGGLGLLDGHVGSSQVSDVSAAVCQTAPEQTQGFVPPAVLLSPPRQVDKWPQGSGTHPVQLHQQIPPVHLLHSCRDIQARGSASSLHSQQLTRPPSSSSSSSPSLLSEPHRLSPQALLAELAQLSRQNEQIKVQLSQAQSDRSAGGGSLSRSSEPRRSSSGSAGRVTPQMSASSSTGRRCHAAEEEPLSQKTTTPDISVDSVEQRLLELNRQSAAARSRLLELIEQQKQSTSVKVSPSVSPIPPSAFSPNTSAEASVLQLEQDLRSDRGGRRSAGSDVSSHSSGGQSKESTTQTNSQRQRGGWFALSSHVK